MLHAVLFIYCLHCAHGFYFANKVIIHTSLILKDVKYNKKVRYCIIIGLSRRRQFLQDVYQSHAGKIRKKTEGCRY